MVCFVCGKRMYLWRAVDDEGEVLDMLMYPYRDSWRAAKYLANLIANQTVWPESITTDGYAGYRKALKHLKVEDFHRKGRLRENNSAENSHLPIRRRERKMRKFKSQASAQRFLTTHAAIYNTFYTQPHLISRPGLRRLRSDAFRVWEEAASA